MKKKFLRTDETLVHNLREQFQEFGGVKTGSRLKSCLTQRALDWRVRAAFSGIFLGSSRFR